MKIPGKPGLVLRALNLLLPAVVNRVAAPILIEASCLGLKPHGRSPRQGDSHAT